MVMVVEAVARGDRSSQTVEEAACGNRSSQVVAEAAVRRTTMIEEFGVVNLHRKEES